MLISYARVSTEDQSLALQHDAFLSPFPNSIAAEVGKPAQDPSGIDRGAVLEEINGEIVDFFHENLVRK